MATDELRLTHRAIEPRQTGSGPAPALLLLHGRGANEDDLPPIAAELDPRLFVVSARAPLVRSFGYHWYDLIASGVPEPTTYAESLATLQAFVRALPSAYPIAAGQLYLLGFSQGAMMAGSLLLTVPDLIAGAILLSGYLPLEVGLPVQTAALAGKPVFIGHGTADQVLPVSFGRQARDYLRTVNADLTYHEYPMAHQISGRELLDIGQWLGRNLTPSAEGMR